MARAENEKVTVQKSMMEMEHRQVSRVAHGKEAKRAARGVQVAA